MKNVIIFAVVFALVFNSGKILAWAFGPSDEMKARTAAIHKCFEEYKPYVDAMYGNYSASVRGTAAMNFCEKKVKGE